MNRAYKFILFTMLALSILPTSSFAQTNQVPLRQKVGARITISSSLPTAQPDEKMALSTAITSAAGSTSGVINGTPFQIISFSDGSVAVYRNGIQQFYSARASGVYLWVGGYAWGPAVPANRTMPNAYQELGVSGPIGDGSPDSPWMLSTRLVVPEPQLQIEQRISYVNGNDYIGYEWIVQNNSAVSQNYTLFHAGDLFLNGDDLGIGYYNPDTNAVGGRNRTQDQFELFVPATPPSAYEEASYSAIWSAISANGSPGSGFSNTTDTNYIDNGAGLQWANRILAAGESESIRDYVSFANTAINPALVADAERSTLNGAPTEVLADGRANATLTVTLLDSQGRPVPGKLVQIRSERPEDRIIQPSTQTDAQGRAQAEVRSDMVGNAVLIAEDLTDGITLNRQAIITFVEPPVSDFANTVRQFTQSGQDDIGQAADSTNQVTQVGRYFAVQRSSDLVKAVVGTLLDGLSLDSALSGFNASLASKSISHMNTPGYKAALNASWQGYTKNGSAERHFLKPLYDRMHNARVLTSPELYQVFKSSISYLGPKFAKKFATDLSGAGTRKIIEYVLTQTTDPFAEYAADMQELADSYSTELNVPRDELLAALPNLGLSSSEEAAYRTDMQGRKDANLALSKRIADQTAYMQRAKDAREAQAHNFWYNWGPFLAKNGAVIGATLVWDGPGYYIANLLGEGVGFAWNRWQDVKKLQEDGRMLFDSLAYLNGTEASLTLQRINQNTMNGLYLVKTHDVSVLPQVSLGLPTQYSTGTCRNWLGTKFVEDGSYTIVNVYNNTSEDVTLEAWATYQHKPGWFSTPVQLYREAPGIILSPQQNGVLRFDYRSGGEGDSPIDPSVVSITVIGSTSTGTYLVKNLDAQYVHPQHVDASGNPVDCWMGTTERQSASVANQNVPTVSFPLRSSIAQATDTDNRVLTVFAENPLTTALQAIIVQPIPSGMIVADAGGGMVSNGQIEWSQILGPGQPTLFTAILQPIDLATNGTLPGTQLNFTNPDTAEETQFATLEQALPPAIAADIDVALPDRITVSTPIDISINLHNRQSTGSLSGTMQLDIRSLDDMPLVFANQTLMLEPSATTQLTLTLDAPSTPGSYMIVGQLVGAPGAPRSFSALVRVEEAPTPPPTPAITFVSHRDGNDEIYRMDADGSNQLRLTNTMSAEGWPGMSADARQITFWSARDGNQEIYKMDADGGNQQRLTFNNAIDEAPAWSPDGHFIAFMSTRNGNNEIYVMDSDGNNQRRLTFNSADDNAPVWSPDGQLIAFRSRRDGNDEIYAMNADGSNQRQLTFNSADDRAPAWSPDGGSIAFHSRRDGNWEIYVINADGANPKRLTNSASTEQTPSWSPDGRQIVFMSTQSGNQDVYVMNVDGSNVQRLTFSSANDHSPGWWSR